MRCNVYEGITEQIMNEYIENLLYKKPSVSADQLLYRDFDTEAVYKALARKGETLKHRWQKCNAVSIVDGRKSMSIADIILREKCCYLLLITDNNNLYSLVIINKKRYIIPKYIPFTKNERKILLIFNGKNKVAIYSATEIINSNLISFINV